MANNADLSHDLELVTGLNETLRQSISLLRADKEKLTAERDHLRAEVDRLREYNELVMREREDRIAIVAGLRGALEDAGDVVHACVCETEEIRGKVCHPSCMAINAAFALTLASARNRLKADALRETATELENLRDYIQEYIGPDDARDDIRRICWNRAKDLRAEADRLAAEEKEAANG